MNKKFTFMVAALLAAGGFSANAAVEKTAVDKVTELKDGGQYYLVFDGDAAANNADITYGKTDNEYFLGVKNNDGTISASNAKAADASLSEKALLWTVKSHTQADGKIYYSFYNAEAETYLTVNSAGLSSTQTKELKAATSEASSYFSFKTTAVKYDGTKGALLVVDNTGVNTNKHVKVNSNFSLATESIPVFYAVEAAPQTTKDASILNATMAGDGFSFAPVDKNTPVEDANNLFSKAVKAFYISGFSADEQTVPAGMYFATSYPEELEGENTIVSLELFEQCTFIAVSPNETYQTSSVTANGLKLVEKTGAELVKYSQSDDDYKTKGDKVYVGNAAFTVTIQNPTAEKVEDYQYTLATTVRYEKEAGKEHATEGVAIAVTKIAGTYYVTTDTNASAFKTVDSTVADPMSFVADEKMPSIYNIQFVSEVKNEKGKYLGVGLTDGASAFEFVAQGEALVDLEAPQYRFVVSDVDAENKTITLKNWETGKTLDAIKLYEVKEGVYRIKTNNAQHVVQIAKEDKVICNNYVADETLNNKEITLTKVDAAPTAGFLVKEKDNNEPFKLAFAKTATSNDKVYVALDKDNNVVLSEKAGEAIQVVFEPELKTDGTVKVYNVDGASKTTYKYKNEDGQELTASAYMGTYYKYALRVVGTTKQYIKIDSKTWKLSSNAVYENIAKVNPEASISLVSALAYNNTEISIKENAGKLVITSEGKPGYLVPNSDGTNINQNVSLFLEAEELGLSLEAKSQHVSLEAERGGFLNVNEANEGVVAIRTEAAEDLTFWLDTTDSKAMIPSFYISKGGKFMYNSADSLAAVKPGEVNPYKVAVAEGNDAAKAIFKAGELVDSETLKTTVNKKETIVKVAADQNKGILGGLKNFQYNIVKPNETEDNYVIRSANDYNYLTSVNGVLAFISDKDNAMRVIVETQSAPTSNEGVSASEVKVVANNGSVVVKNAAGKNVVVSTI